MNKLVCYGITRRALQFLLHSAEPQSKIPDGWFNWLNRNPGNHAIERLKLLDPDQHDAQVLTWNHDAKKAGYGCVLVYSTDDPRLQTDHAVGLSDDVVIHPISHMPTETELNEHIEVLTLLREPEHFFINGWALVTCGGGVSIDKLGLSKVAPAHWWAYGQGLAEWIRSSADGQADSIHRKVCADYSSWNYMKEMGIEYPDTKLDAQWCWNSPPDDSWRWNLSNPCTPKDIPEMSLDGFVAYYPMRQMPCCGVAIRLDGILATVGALPNEKDANGNWIWDDGSLRKALAPQSFKDVMKALIGAGRAVVVALTPIPAGSLGLASGTAGQRQFLLEGGHQTFLFDQNLQLTTSEAAPIGLSLTQKVETTFIPQEDSFELITSVWIKSDSQSSFSVGVMVNGDEPRQWRAGSSNKKIELRERIHASDEIRYVLRRKS